MGIRRYFRKKKKIQAKRPQKPEQDVQIKTVLPETSDHTTKFGGLLRDAPVRLFFWPDYNKGNKYQNLLYGAPISELQISPGTIDEALRWLHENGTQKTVFHLHWINFLFVDFRDWAIGEVFDDFLEKCAKFRDMGGVLLWTVHNLTEHESVDIDVEVIFRKQLTDLADAVFVHGEAVKKTVIQTYSADPGKIVVIDHGNYVGAYPDTVNVQDARKKLNLDDHATVFVHLGAIKSYKGVSKLFEQAKTWEPQKCSNKLLLAGRIPAQELADVTEHAASNENIILYPRWIGDEEIQLFLNASDFAVFPYQRILTSGSAILALSFSIPVIAPALGNLNEIIKHGQNGFLYDPDDPNALASVMKLASQMTAVERAEMRYNAFVSVSAMRWSTVRHKLFQTIDQL